MVFYFFFFPPTVLMVIDYLMDLKRVTELNEQKHRMINLVQLKMNGCNVMSKKAQHVKRNVVE